MDKVGELDGSRRYWSSTIQFSEHGDRARGSSTRASKKGRCYKFAEEADLRLLKFVSLHGAHLAERGQKTALFVDVAVIVQYDGDKCVIEDSMGALQNVERGSTISTKKRWHLQVLRLTTTPRRTGS
jgi:hypothetical protein